MTKKEYQKIMEELNAKSFYHDYSSITENAIERESIPVVSLQDAFSILRKHVKKRRKPARKIQINIKG